MSRLPGREAAFEAALRGRWGHPLEVHDLLGSTQDRCAELAEEDAPEGALVVALGQSAGRGRRGATWFAPPGKALLLSLLLRPEEPARSLAGRLSLGASLALAEALEPWAPEIQLKWPNDLVAGGRKLAGILPEGRLEGERYRFVSLGLGLNLGQAGSQFPEELHAVSLGMLTDRPPSPEEAAAAFLERLEALDLSPGSDLLQRWRARWPHAGRGARQGEERLRLLDVDEEGRLLVEGQRGGRALSAGDVSLILEEA